MYYLLIHVCLYAVRINLLHGFQFFDHDDVLTERRLEFVGEGKRYFDLVRAEGISGASASNKATTALVPDEYGYRTNSWTAKKKYIPIAQGELDSDPALVQNAYK